MRAFKANKFPKGKICPLCKTSEPGVTYIIPVDNTERAGFGEAVPVHKECFHAIGRFRYNRRMDIIYASNIMRDSLSIRKREQEREEAQVLASIEASKLEEDES